MDGLVGGRPMDDDALGRSRSFLKDDIRQKLDFSTMDQARGIPPPPIQKPCDPDAMRVTLPTPDDWQVEDVGLTNAIRNRESCRRFSDEPLRLDELSFLLWATQGIRKRLKRGGAMRTVPSAGARHAFETYLCVMNISGLEPGIYRYLPDGHELVFTTELPDLRNRLTEATLGQSFVGRAAVTFVWTALPYRMEWRYGLAAHKVIAIDAGHVCQNLYLACEAIQCGTCAIAAYDQPAMDELIGIDGQDEFTIYLAPVGRK